MGYSKRHGEVLQYLKDTAKFQPADQTVYNFDEMNILRKGSKRKNDFKADYVYKNAWIDVIYYEGWMESLGKFIVYGNQILKDNKQFWIIFYAKGLIEDNHYSLKHSQFERMENDERLLRLREIYLTYKKIAENVLVEKLRDQLRVYDFDPDLSDPLYPI
jgi:hypothetical protein